MTTLRSIFRALIGGNTGTPPPTISEVETRACADSYTIDAIVANPLHFDIFDESFRTFCATNAAELLPRLKHQVSSRPATEQIAVARLLSVNGDASASDILLDILETGDIEAQHQAIVALGMRAIGRANPAPVDETRVLRVLRPWLQSAETHWRKNAADILFSLSLPEVREIKLAMLADPAIKLRMAAAAALAREGDAAAWPVLRDTLLSPSEELQRERYWAIGHLKDLAAGRDDALQGDIAHLAARQIEAQFDREDNTTANEVWNSTRRDPGSGTIVGSWLPEIRYHLRSDALAARPRPAPPDDVAGVCITPTA